MKKTLLFLFVISLFHLNYTYAQNEKFKALYMYNFTKFLEWDKAERDGDFIITVLGDKKMAEELKIIAEKKKVGLQKMVIKFASIPSEIYKSHIIYISQNNSKHIEDIISKNLTTCTLVISDDKDGIPKGAGINYVLQGGKPLFEISKTNIAKHNVKVSSELLSLGIQK